MLSPKPLALSVKIVIRDNTGRCLLLKRSMSSKGNPGKWDLPGGKIDAGEDFEQALVREVAEETGLRIAIDGPAGTASSESPGSRIIYLIMEGRVESGEVRLSAEHDEYVWAEAGKLWKIDFAEQFLAFAKGYSRRTDDNGSVGADCLP